AHLRRGDPWVRRLELLAGLLWWWNPLYWIVRHRLDVEAELACDAWVVSALPELRFAYAEALIDVCESLSEARAPSPALGMGGPGRIFERRLTMILRERIPCRASAPALLAAGLLALLALPSWAPAKEEEADMPKDGKVLSLRLAKPDAISVFGPVQVKAEVLDEAAKEKGDIRLIVFRDEDDEDRDDDDRDEDKRDRDQKKDKRVIIRRSESEEGRRDEDRGRKEGSEAREDPKRADSLKKAQAEVAQLQRELAKARDQMRAAQQQLAKNEKALAAALSKLAALQGKDVSRSRAEGERITSPRIEMRFRKEDREDRPGPHPEELMPPPGSPRPLLP
ncbi:MAG: M56 family metallopeptidase, partial [Isosphaeraceae bacterium]|nr:M56 family metallopeptidase [Isosphaeraceae bacterium]